MIARDSAAKLAGATTRTSAFYEGKRYAALYFARNVLPGVAAQGAADRARGSLRVEIPVEAFVS